MLEKTLTGIEVLEIVHKHLEDSGLTIVKNNGDRIGLITNNTISFEVEMTPVKQAPAIHYPTHVRGPLESVPLGGRGILDGAILCNRGETKVTLTEDGL